MADRADIVYRYDGSFAGLMCCVFHSVYRREAPAAIEEEETAQQTLLPVRHIPTDEVQAGRVLRSIPEKLGRDALSLVRLTFLSCLEEREQAILRFLRLGYQTGPKVTRMLADERVAPLWEASRQVLNEAHLLKGFARFSDRGGVLVAEIEPKCRVLTLLQPHFGARMAQESFLVYDRTHGEALLHSGGRSQIVPFSALDLPPMAAEERLYRALWKRFYDTVAIEGRYNPVCRRTHMPQRYWNTMTEFDADLPAALPGQEGAAPPERKNIPCGKDVPML